MRTAAPRRSRLGTIVLVTLMAGGVAACSPAPESLLAVEAVDGSTTRLLTMTCSEFTANHFAVNHDDGADDDLRD